MKPDVYNWSSTAYDYVIETNQGDKLTTLFIMTRHGFVRASIGYGGTFIQFVWNGVAYMREIKKEYSRRYAVTLAKRFVKEITGQ